MAALKASPLQGTVTWLGWQPRPVRNLVIDAEPLTEMPLTLAGLEGEVHAGLTRPSCSRVTALYPRGTSIRNTRQLSLVSAEELAGIGAEMGLDFDPAWAGASVVIAGIPDFTHLPPSSRLQGPDGVTLVVDMENLPCREPAETIERVHPGRGAAFLKAARGRRGVTAWVEREGVLRIGDSLRLFVPAQRGWEPAR